MEKKWGSYNIQNDIRMRILKSSIIIKEFKSMVEENLPIIKQKTQYRNIPSGF